MAAARGLRVTLTQQQPAGRLHLAVVARSRVPAQLAEAACAARRRRMPLRLQLLSGLLLAALFRTTTSGGGLAPPPLSAIDDAEAWPYSPRMNWTVVPTFFFATTNLTVDGTIDAQSMAFLQNFPLIVMPKIQGPNTRNVTDPARPTPGCCAEDRIGRAAAFIKQQHRDPDVRVLMYISSCRLFPYYRLTSELDESTDFLRHLNGSLFTETVGGPGQQWWYDYHTADFTRSSVTEKYLRAVRATLMEHKAAIDGIFADSSGDLRVAGGANMHLNQTKEFESAWDAGHASMLTQLQAVVAEVLGPRGLLVANNADRPAVRGRNFETLGPTASPYITDETLTNRSFRGDSIEAIQHEEAAARVALVRGGYYTQPGSDGWEKGYANCLPPSAFSKGEGGGWDPKASQIFNRTLAGGAIQNLNLNCAHDYNGTTRSNTRLNIA